MKAGSNRIMTTDQSVDNITYEQFLESEYAESLTGKLYIALLAEETWSSEFTAHVRFSKYDHTSHGLSISHLKFPYSRSLTIKEGEAVTVEDVEKIIGEKCKEWSEQIRMAEEELRCKRDVVAAFKNNMLDAKHTHLIRQRTGCLESMIHHRDVAGGIWQGDGYEDWQAYYTSGNSKDNTVYFCNLKTKQVRIMRNAGHHELASCGSFIKKSSPYTFGHLIDQAEEVVEQPSVDLQFVESQDEVLRK